MTQHIRRRVRGDITAPVIEATYKAYHWTVCGDVRTKMGIQRQLTLANLA